MSTTETAMERKGKDVKNRREESQRVTKGMSHSREKDIVNHDSRDQQRQEREQNSAKEELLHIVVTRVNAVPKDVLLLAWRKSG